MNILLIDGFPLFREGIKALLKANYPQSLTVVETASVAEARRSLSLSSNSFDLILLDLQLDDTHGVDSLICIKRFAGRSPIVVLAADGEQSITQLCINNGAAGFLSKRTSATNLLIAIQRVLAGKVYIPMVPAIPERSSERSFGHESILARLSKRQREVLGLLLQGKPNKSISNHMDISQNTVKAHLSAIFKVLGASNRTEVVYFAARAGLPLE
ncbi:MAG: response regulator transcription factor [Granulosicoccaceae bacterium]